MRMRLQVKLRRAANNANDANGRSRLKALLVSAALGLFAAGPAFTQEWIEFASQEERITCLFPTQPKVTEITWASEYGAVLPARVYSATQGQSRYSLTV